MVARLGCLLGLFLFVVGTPLWAHPHVWVDVKVEAVVDSGVLLGLGVEMTLDDMYSSLILEDTAPQARALDAQAIEAIRTSYFQDLGHFDHLTHLTWGKNTLKVPTPERFSAALGAQGRLTYQFFLPLTLRLAVGTVFGASFFDESYYVDVGFVPKTPVTLKSLGAGTPSLNLKKPSGTTDAWVAPASFELRWKP